MRPAGGESTRCRRCNRPIRLLRDSRKPQRLALDPRPDAAGSVQILEGEQGRSAVRLAGESLERAQAAREPLYRPHAQTCEGRQ